MVDHVTEHRSDMKAPAKVELERLLKKYLLLQLRSIELGDVYSSSCRIANTLQDHVGMIALNETW